MCVAHSSLHSFRLIAYSSRQSTRVTSPLLAITQKPSPCICVDPFFLGGWEALHVVSPMFLFFYFLFSLIEGKRQWRELLKRWCAPIGKCVADGEEELERADFPSSGELSLVAFLFDVKRTAFRKQHS